MANVGLLAHSTCYLHITVGSEDDHLANVHCLSNKIYNANNELIVAA